MRTTLTLDDDIAAQLTTLRERDRRPFRELVNEALRVGLARLDQRDATRQGPYTRPVSLGAPRLPDIDDVSDVLAIAEDEDHR